MKKFVCGLLAAAFIVTLLCGCSDGGGSSSNISIDSNGVISSTAGSKIEFNFVYSEGLDDNGYFEGIRALDYVTLPDYKNVEIPEDIFVADPGTVQENISTLLSETTDYERIMDRPIADGDDVCIDYVGYIDGVAFEGGSTNGSSPVVTIGSTKYIDDFIDQLIGHMPGDRFDVHVTFPEDYGKENLNGKDAVFDVTINYIRGDQVTATITDSVAETYGFDDAEALMAAINESVIFDQIQEYMYELLGESECSEIPETVFNYVADYMINAYYSEYSYDGMINFGTFLNTVGYSSIEDYRTKNREAIEDTAKLFLCIQALCEAENLAPTEAQREESGYDTYIDTFGLPYVNRRLLEDHVVPDYIRELAGQ